MVRKCVLLLAAVIAVNSALLLLLGTWQAYGDDRRVAEAQVHVHKQLQKKTGTKSVFHGCLEGVLTMQWGGRFGNNFMEYASALGISRKYNLTLVLPEHIAAAMKEAFEGVDEPTVEEFLKGRNGSDGAPCAPRLPEEVVLRRGLRWYTPTHEPILKGSGPIVLRKYTFQEKYIVPLAPTLRAKLHFQPQLREPALALLRKYGEEVAAAASARQEEVVHIGIHVRRTDYHEFLQARNYTSEPAGESYYVQAVALLRGELAAEREAGAAAQRGAQAPRLPLAVAVVSDDMDWVRRRLVPALQAAAQAETGTVTGVFAAGSGREEDTMKDLALLSSCNHTVLSYGTFGITAALLSGGRAFVPYVNNPKYHTRRFASLLPNWTVLE